MILTKKTITAGVAAAAVAVAAAGPAQAGQFGSEYSWNEACTKPVDPIGVVFFGTGSGYFLTGDDGRGHLHYHTGWKHHTYVVGEEGEQCYPAGARGSLPSLTHQPASAPGPGHSRYHIRLWAGPAGNPFRDSHGNLAKLGTPHHEDWVQGCKWGRGGHAIDKGAVDRGKEWETDKGSGFDQGRRKLVVRFRKDPRGNGRHPYFNAVWGNTRSMKQCDGDYAGSNGNVAWLGVAAG